MAEAEQSLQSISEHLDCTICEDRLKNPKDLNCSHTFCLECLNDYARSINATKRIPCPLCRQVTKLPRGGIAALKTSFLLRNLVDAVPVEDARLPKDPGCESIEERVKTCSIHKGVPRDIYCETCNVLVCQKCIGTGHFSTGHHHYKLDQRASFARNFLKALCVETEDNLEDVDSWQEQMCKIEQTLHDSKEATIKKINDHVKKAISNVAHQQDTLIDELNRKYQAEVEAVQRHKDRLEILRSRLQTHHNDTQAIARSPDDENVVLNESKLATRSESHRGKLEFNSGSAYFDFQEADVKIGSLNNKLQENAFVRKKISSSSYWVMCNTIAELGYVSPFRHRAAINPGGSLLAVPNRSAIELYNVDTGKLVRTIRGSHAERLKYPTGVIFLPNGLLAVTDRAYQFVRLFSQDGEFHSKFPTLDTSKDESTKVELTCIAIDPKHDVVAVGDGKRNVLTLHQADGTYLQTLYLNIEPMPVLSVDICVAACLVAVGNVARVHILSLTGRKLFVLDKYGDTYWPLVPTGVCFHPNSKFLYVSRSIPLGEKSIHQYSIPSGKYIGCIYKGLDGPSGLTFLKNDKLAVVDGSSVKILQNMAESGTRFGATYKLYSSHPRFKWDM